MTEDEIAREIVDSAFQIHTALGPGLLKRVYHLALAFELEHRGLTVQRECEIPSVYKDVQLAVGFRADLIVGSKVIVEIKSVESFAAVHKKQLLTYLRLADKRLGLLLNFDVAVIKHGICRVVNGLEHEWHSTTMRVPSPA